MSTAVQESADYLNALAKALHRGRGDTWGAARDRAAKLAGIEATYAKRIWDRWQTMSDVSGEAYRRLRSAYESTCTRIENAADAIEARRHEIEERHAALARTQTARQRDDRTGVDGAANG